MEDLIGYLDEIQSQLTFAAEIRSNVSAIGPRGRELSFRRAHARRAARLTGPPKMQPNFGHGAAT